MREIVLILSQENLEWEYTWQLFGFLIRSNVLIAVDFEDNPSAKILIKKSRDKFRERNLESFPLLLVTGEEDVIWAVAEPSYDEMSQAVGIKNLKGSDLLH